MLHINISQCGFAIELLLAAFLFYFSFPLRNKAYIRIPLSIGILLFSSMISIFDTNKTHRIVINSNVYLQSIYYIYMFILIILSIWFIFYTDILEAIIAGTAAYITQHLAYDIFCYVLLIFQIDMKEVFTRISFRLLEVIIYGGIYIVIYLLFYKRIHLVKEQISRKFVWLLLSLLMIAFIIFLNLIGGVKHSGVIAKIFYLYDSIGTIFSLVILFYLSKTESLTDEVEKLENMLKIKKEYYEFSKENIQLVNTRCHDIRQHLDELSLIDKNKVTTNIIDQIRNDINIYDNISKTGNDALDVVLTEKQLTCMQKEIKLACMADGNQMKFMEPIDIYFLIGNILQNAIDAVEKLKCKDRRNISLLIKRNKDFLLIQAENYFENPIMLESGIPVTSKMDKLEHGIGMKSMNLLVHKYRGEISIKLDNNIFLYNILIPIKEK